MIIAILGGVGSGKTLSATKTIVSKNNLAFTNFNVRDKNIIRLKKSHIIAEEVTGTKKSGEEIKKLKVNWDFWNKAIKKYKGFDIYLDEIHNLVHSRMSMTKHNTLMSIWFSQIRKILGESEGYHIFLISQKIFRIDVAFRDLIGGIIYCEKKKTKTKIDTYVYDGKNIVIKQLPLTIVLHYYFFRENPVEDFLLFKTNKKLAQSLRLYKKRGFIANDYFQYFDSYKIVKFGEDVYL